MRHLQLTRFSVSDKGCGLAATAAAAAALPVSAPTGRKLSLPRFRCSFVAGVSLDEEEGGRRRLFQDRGNLERILEHQKDPLQLESPLLILNIRIGRLTTLEGRSTIREEDWIDDAATQKKVRKLACNNRDA